MSWDVFVWLGGLAMLFACMLAGTLIMRYARREPTSEIPQATLVGKGAPSELMHGVRAGATVGARWLLWALGAAIFVAPWVTAWFWLTTALS